MNSDASFFFTPLFAAKRLSFVTTKPLAAPAFDTTTVYAAGPGAASGFVVTKDSLFAAKSGVKKNDASLFKVDVPPASLPGAPNFTPVWWKEQK